MRGIESVGVSLSPDVGFMEITDSDERERVKRDAFERVAGLMEELGLGLTEQEKPDGTPENE